LFLNHVTNCVYIPEIDLIKFISVFFSAFPFAAESNPSSEKMLQPVVLAPDTCFTNTSEIKGKENHVKPAKEATKQSNIQNKDNLQKSPKRVSVYKFFEPRKPKKTVAVLSEENKTLLKNTNFCKVDPDVTRLDRKYWNNEDDVDNDDDEVMFSIPGSPVLSSNFVTNRKQESCAEDDHILDEVNESPSLLTSAQNLKVIQSLLTCALNEFYLLLVELQLLNFSIYRQIILKIFILKPV